MPGPFPGMDPYLENTNYWRGLHNNVIAEFTFQLNAVLPEQFVARSAGRCYSLPLHQLSYEKLLSPIQNSGDTTTIAETPPIIIEHSAQTIEIEESHIEIYNIEQERVVTVIELLSPSNKTLESTEHNEYTKERCKILHSSAHFIEIDLLRSGQHTVAIPYKAVASRRHFDYLINLRRADSKFNQFECWPFTVQERMPTIRVPLAAGWPDTLADLQSVFDSVYDKSRMRQQVNYKREPEPPLSPADTAWADALLKNKGLRES